MVVGAATAQVAPLSARALWIDVLVNTVGGMTGTLVAAAILWALGRLIYSWAQARRVEFQYVVLSTTSDGAPMYGGRFVRIRNNSARTIFNPRGRMRGVAEDDTPTDRPVFFYDTDGPVSYERRRDPHHYATQVDPGGEAWSALGFGRNEVLTSFDYNFFDGDHAWSCTADLAPIEAPTLLRGRLRRSPFWANRLLDRVWYPRH